MGYKICPKCGLNVIAENESLCQVCKGGNGGKKEIKQKTYTNLICGRDYGTNSRGIYLDCCNSFGWSISKASEFGVMGAPLYASNCADNGKRDVWFICYLNKNIVENGKTNEIYKNGDEIVETVDYKYGKANEAERITFVKKKGGYEFLGVYRLIENGIIRKYERISKYYPL